MSVYDVKKPWPVFLMAIWAIFGIGSFLTSVPRVLFSNNEFLFQVTSLGAVIAIILLMYFLVKFNRKALIIFAVSSFSLALFQIINVLQTLLVNGFSSIIYFLLYYIIPSILLGWLALTKKYLSDSARYAIYLKEEARRKIVMKAMKR